MTKKLNRLTLLCLALSCTLVFGQKSDAIPGANSIDSLETLMKEAHMWYPKSSGFIDSYFDA